MVATAGIALAQDYWLGQVNNGWSTGCDMTGTLCNWSTDNPPMPTDDVVIYSGGYDFVILNTSATIDSLQLGGAINGFYSELNDYGIASTLTITNALTIGATGVLVLNSAGSSVSASSIVNNGSVNIYGGTLNLTNQPGGITDVVAGSGYLITGTFTAGLNSAFANLTRIEGVVGLVRPKRHDHPERWHSHPRAC
jgi:hypothetical protein